MQSDELHQDLALQEEGVTTVCKTDQEAVLAALLQGGSSQEPCHRPCDNILAMLYALDRKVILLCMVLCAPTESLV